MAVLQLETNNMSTLPQGCNTWSATMRTVGCASSGLNSLPQTVYCWNINIKVVCSLSRSLASMKSSEDFGTLLHQESCHAASVESGMSRCMLGGSFYSVTPHNSHVMSLS